ncbi:nitrogen fixation protein NifZ [Anaerobacillus alkalilacustris]|uniref:Nitrogen fixation protein NifZ n=1 Tax=Anaerobacillus alkalilacustris TaxID=393763 RepID=A0A1S2LYK3_9BACI|nr:nitrogen fixation protein NifZ [Anaerobacillus alkalilacustris]OIJ17293.1 nitrogen fixation protein NifZ [Anaerobacillus alkalilacustris]
MLYKYDLDERVVITKDLRNDGTVPNYERGEIIVKKGTEGVVVDHGYFLQDILIYSVYLSGGFIVGCMERELQSLDKEETV